MSSPPFDTFALIVFGSTVFDLALATDFVMISKKFIADGLAPTLVSGTHLQDITTIHGPFFFGREDLRERTKIYDSQEASTPFYELVTRGLKGRIMRWIEDVSSQVHAGDRIIIVFIAHGKDEKGAISLHCQHGPVETLSKAEALAGLSILPPHVRLLIVNEACFSGTWVTIASELPQRDILVETAATLGEKSWAYMSGSGRNRCSLFGAAFVEEITTHPEGRISNHRSRIEEEMRFVPPHQETSTPLVISSARALYSHNISHFILSPKIATAITNITSSQQRHESLLRGKSSARTFWSRVLHLITPSHEPSQSFTADAADMKMFALQRYIEDLGPLRNCLAWCGLAGACQLALEGKGPKDLGDQALATIAWQDSQYQRIDRLLEHLARRELLVELVNFDVADQMLKNHPQRYHFSLGEKLSEGVDLDNLFQPPRTGHVDVHFSDAWSRLVLILDYNNFLYPGLFDFDRAREEIIQFLRDTK